MKNDPKISALIQALNPELGLITKLIPEINIFSRLDELDAPILDFLALQLHVDFYDSSASLEIKRESVKNSILWHMHKGTSWAIIQALKNIGVDAEFIHWKDFQGEPYTFKIHAEITGDYYRTVARDKIIAKIRDVINDSKAARSSLIDLESVIKFSEQINIFTGNFNLLSGQEIIKLPKIIFPENNKIFQGTAKFLFGAWKIFPDRLKEFHNIIYSGVVSCNNISHSIGVDLETMQELLLQFEKRIFSRLDAFENDIKLIVAEQNKKIDNKLAELEALLQWKNDSED